MKQTTPSNSDTYRVLSRPPCRQAGSPTKTRQIALEASAMRPPRRLSRAPLAHAMIEHHYWTRILSAADGFSGMVRYGPQCGSITRRNES